MAIRLIVVIAMFASIAEANGENEWLGATVIQTPAQPAARTTLPPAPHETVRTLEELYALAFENNPTLSPRSS